MYNDKLSTDEQITAEEQIASVIFDYYEGIVSEQGCAELGRQILRNVLQQFRPDLIEDEDQAFIAQLETRSMSSWSDEELKRYSRLTGQEEAETQCPQCGSYAVVVTGADETDKYFQCHNCGDTWATKEEEEQEP